MVISDKITGTAFALAGAFMAWRAQGFPVPSGAASPRLFPTIVGGLMLLAGALIVLRSLRAPTVPAPDPASGPASDTRPDPSPNPWLAEPRKLAMVLGVPVFIIAFGLLAPIIGALPMSILLVSLYALMWSERPLPAIITGIVVGVVMVALFTRVMNVQLPRGLLGMAL